MNELQYAKEFFEAENVEPLESDIIKNVLSDKLRRLYEFWVIKNMSITDCARSLSVSTTTIQNMQRQLHDALSKNQILAEKYKSIHGHYPYLVNKSATKRQVCDLDFVLDPYAVSALIRFTQINSQSELIELIESGEDLKSYRFIGDAVYTAIMEWYKSRK